MILWGSPQFDSGFDYSSLSFPGHRLATTKGCDVPQSDPVTPHTYDGCIELNMA